MCKPIFFFFLSPSTIARCGKQSWTREKNGGSRFVEGMPGLGGTPNKPDQTCRIYFARNKKTLPTATESKLWDYSPHILGTFPHHIHLLTCTTKKASSSSLSGVQKQQTRCTHTVKRRTGGGPQMKSTRRGKNVVPWRQSMGGALLGRELRSGWWTGTAPTPGLT